MRYRITAPVPGATCSVAGVAFDNSVGETDNPAAVAYFERHGYQVDEIATGEPDGDPAQPADTPPAPTRPAKSASTEAWREYAKAMGMDEQLADATSRDDLVAHYEAKEADK